MKYKAKKYETYDNRWIVVNEDDQINAIFNSRINAELWARILNKESVVVRKRNDEESR